MTCGRFNPTHLARIAKYKRLRCISFSFTLPSVGNPALDVQAIGAAMRVVGAASVKFSPEGQVLELVLGAAPANDVRAQLSPDETAEQPKKPDEQPDFDVLLFASSAG